MRRELSKLWEKKRVQDTVMWHLNQEINEIIKKLKKGKKNDENIVSEKRCIKNYCKTIRDRSKQNILE